MKRRISGVAAFITALLLSAIACRQGEPTGDPRTPVNSPIPEIDRKEEEPKAPPTPSIGDAG
ncbi:MAG: hypothetical protein KF764_06945 [Labilithrix sp.]|nr:hypothetical protein [Labilithrix sp.]MBX3219368.1 hypothetical protein [Labilithrix sp.]